MGQIWLPKKLSKLMDETNTQFIGIKGASGAGKTTATKIMRAHFSDSIVLQGNHYLSKAILSDPELCESVFGKVFKNQNALWDYYYKNENPELLRKLVINANQHIADMYVEDIGNLLSQNYIPNPIIGEYAYLNTMPEVWERIATHRVGINTPITKVAENLGSRDGVDTSRLRYEACSDLYDVGTPGIEITNNGTLQEFKQKIESLCGTIGAESNTLLTNA